MMITLLLIKVNHDGEYEETETYETTDQNHDNTKSHITQAIARADYIYRLYPNECDIIKGRPTEISVGWIPLRKEACVA